MMKILKQLSFSLVLLLALGHISFCQVLKKNEPKILAIRSTIQKINANKSLKEITLDNEVFLTEMPDGGGSLTGYFKQDSIYKIKEWIGLSYGFFTKEYYFKNQELIAVTVTENKFYFNDSTQALDPSITTLNYKAKYYYINQKLYYKKIVGERSFSNEEDKGAALLQNAKKYLALLKAKGTRAR